MKPTLRTFTSRFGKIYGMIGAERLASTVSRFWRRVKHSAHLMTTLEKRMAIVLVFLAIFAGIFRVYLLYLNETRPIPDFGGTYSEAVVGELKYLNPVWAQSDADRAASKLVFSGLVKFEGDKVVPDIADRWEIAPDGLTYKFFLRKDVLFHDGTPLTTEDVAYTINLIKSTANGSSESPLLQVWSDVTVTVVDKYEIDFVLPKSYGPFLTHTDFGIMPASLSLDEFNKKFVGTGPFKVEKSKQKNEKNVELDLARNENYYQERPLLAHAKLYYYDKEDEARKMFDKGKVQGLFGTTTDNPDAVNLSYKSSKRLGLLFNLRNDRFKDKEFRRKIIQGEHFNEPTKLRLVTLNAPLQKEKAEELKASLSAQNVQLETIYLSPVQLNDVLASHEFEALLYGFDFGHDRDPYPFWHSTQMEKHNLAGYSDKASDILLEDARMATDDAARNAKYDQFFGVLQSEYLIKFWDPVKYLFAVNKEIAGTLTITGYEPGSRYDNIHNWYVEQKRVKR